MELERATLNALSTQLHTATSLDVTWHSENKSDVERKLRLLNDIWEQLTGLRLYIGHELYPQVEEMRLVILKHLSTLDSTEFRKHTAEFRNGIISARGEASLLGIRLFSTKSRLFERIDRWLEAQDDKRST